MNKFPSKLSISFSYKANHKKFCPFLLSYTSNYSTASKLKPQQQIQRIQSSVPAGTILKGLNFHKDGADPIALPDDDYPNWLWEILDKEKDEQLRNNVYSRQHHKKQRKELIKNNNFDRNRKK
ncbi:mitochondrial ribosomal protein L37-domain-containing protein [Glomus cerebriforme]|uniref:Large ribosomal subunit protein mL54 n=1 Tax=Glomus cerebriforme TaxID=658196 RepID=A0A397TGL0_9GLOM|nr:mitochondrial ribosomal protein L37-domain-containing protein [Glomus cerebriforme]